MIIGIDEVGRGCWAGPLVAAAVGLDDSKVIPLLTDSKALSAKKRQNLISVIKQETDMIGLGWVWPREINSIGLTESVRLAMHRAIKTLNFHGHHIIIDGNMNYLKDTIHKDEPCSKDHPCRIDAVIKADGSIQAVSAASVIAKVARDQYMTQIAEKYPEYGFEKHVGYGTQQHIEALKQYGVLPIHRINYKPIRSLITGVVA